jgi:ketosteroid isomerase-like protein
MSKSIIVLVSLLGIAGASGSIAVAFAAHHGSESSTKRQIEISVHQVEEAFERDESSTAVSHLLYADNVVLLGQDDQRAARGMQAAIDEVRDWKKSLGPGGMKTCRYTIVEPAVASGTTFSSFMLLHCAPNPPVLPQGQELRMMYVWKKFPQGWRVQLEMWAPGNF